MPGADLLKQFDPRKILEAKFGSLGASFGTPFGMYGDFAQFSPKKYFDHGDYFNAEGYFDAKTFLREAAR